MYTHKDKDFKGHLKNTFRHEQAALGEEFVNSAKAGSCKGNWDHHLKSGVVRESQFTLKSAINH